jgi:hypothetical protein
MTALINSNNDWVFEETDLKQLVLNFYQELHSSSLCIDTRLVTQHTSPAIKEEDMALLRNVALDKSALFSMRNYKSSGLDGFHPLLFKSQQSLCRSFNT